MKKILALSILILNLSSIIYASSDTGTSAASFMKIDPAARPAALAGAFVAIADDATAIFYNPAGLGFINRNQVSFTHNEWLEAIRLESLAYAHIISESLTLGFGANYLFSDSISTTTSGGIYTGDTFNTSGGSAMVGLAYKFHNAFSIGANAKVIGEKLADESGFAYAGDIGFLFKHSLQNDIGISFGGSVQNMGTKLKLYKDSFDVPLKYSGGGAISYRYFTLTSVIEKTRDSDNVIRVGSEFKSGNLLFEYVEVALRLGYHNETPDQTGSGITTGIGISFQNFNMDYAFTPIGELGSTHRVTVSVKFGKERNQPNK